MQNPPRASAVALYLACEGSYLMGAAVDVDDSSADSNRGTRIHAALAGHPPDDLTPDEKECAEKCVALWSGRVPWDGGTVYTETEMVISGPGWQFTGHPDRFCVKEDRAWLVDWKSGPKPVTNAAQNPQIKTYALGIVQAYASLHVDAFIVHPPGNPQVSVATFDDGELMAWGRFLAGLYASITSPAAVRRPGDHCRLCRGRSACPEATRWATEEIVTMVPATIPEKIEEIIATLPAAKLATIWRRRAVAIKIFDAVIARLRSMQESELKDWGLRLKPGAERRTVTNPTEVWQRASQLGVTQDQFLTAVNVSLGDLKTVVKVATKRKGEALDSTMTSLLDGCIETTRAQPSITELKDVS